MVRVLGLLIKILFLQQYSGVLVINTAGVGILKGGGYVLHHGPTPGTPRLIDLLDKSTAPADLHSILRRYHRTVGPSALRLPWVTLMVSQLKDSTMTKLKGNTLYAS